MRRNFAQVLKGGKIDLKREYSKLYKLFYGKDKRDDTSLAELISLNFTNFWFRGTCLDLAEFDEEYEFNFVEQPQNFDVDYLISFCEYIYNFVLHFNDSFFFGGSNKFFYLQHISKVIESIAYIQSEEDGLVIFVPKNNVAIAVAELEIIPDEVSYKVIAYDHHSMKGNLEDKKATLLILANLLEPFDKDLNRIDPSFKRDLFYALNNFNIRHNNINSADRKNYKKAIAEMLPDELEELYDETYQMCLLAFMRLEQNERKNKFDKIKNIIENQK